jgi:hypothetical protein
MRNKLFRLASSTIVAGVMAGIVLNAMPQQAIAAEVTGTEGFGTFAAENTLTSSNPGLGGPNGWSYTPDQGVRDVAIVDDGSGDKSLRISNAYTDNSFGNWLFSQRLNVPVEEDADGNEFIADFQFKSTSADYQPGLQVSVSPQSGSGARMSFLRFVDSNDGADGGGIDVYFADNQDDDGVAQRLVQIANNLDRTVAHDVKIVLDLYTGGHNDVANVFIDDMTQPLVPDAGTAGFAGFFAPVDHPDTVNKVKAGQSVPMKWKLGSAAPATTWEDYYRFNPESNAAPVQDESIPGIELLPTPWATRAVDSLIFQARTGGGTALNTLGGGFLFDNVKLTSGDVGTLPALTGPVTASSYGDPIFSWRKITCDTNADIDPLETADVPGASHLTYNADSGVWHYNWQTTGIMKGNCYKLTLNLTGDYALFKIVK